MQLHLCIQFRATNKLACRKCCLSQKTFKNSISEALPTCYWITAKWNPVNSKTQQHQSELSVTALAGTDLGTTFHRLALVSIKLLARQLRPLLTKTESSYVAPTTTSLAQTTAHPPQRRRKLLANTGEEPPGTFWQSYTERTELKAFLYEHLSKQAEWYRKLSIRN